MTLVVKEGTTGRQGMNNQPLPDSTSQGECQGRRPRRATRVAVTTQEALDGSREKTHESREHREQLIELGIDFISGSA